jgi:hypothetical protein
MEVVSVVGVVAFEERGDGVTVSFATRSRTNARSIMLKCPMERF